MTRAVRFDKYGGIDVLHFVEADRPVPGPGQVLVRIKAAGWGKGELRSKPMAKSGRIPPMPFVKIGRHVRYPLIDVLAYEASHRRFSTSGGGAAEERNPRNGTGRDGESLQRFRCGLGRVMEFPRLPHIIAMADSAALFDAPLFGRTVSWDAFWRRSCVQG